MANTPDPTGENQPVPGHLRGVSDNTKPDSTGRDTGLGPNQDKPGYPRSESVPNVQKTGRPDPGPQNRRGYVRDEPNRALPLIDGNLAPDGTRTVFDSSEDTDATEWKEDR